MLVSEYILVPQHFGASGACGPGPGDAGGAVQGQLPFGGETHHMVPGYVPPDGGPLKVVFVDFAILVHGQKAVHISCQGYDTLRCLELAYLAVGESCLQGFPFGRPFGSCAALVEDSPLCQAELVILVESLGCSFYVYFVGQLAVDVVYALGVGHIYFFCPCHGSGMLLVVVHPGKGHAGGE